MKRNRKRPNSGQEVCLGLVILPEPGELDRARDSLLGDGRVELAEAEGHRLPGCVVSRIGEDEQLLDELSGLSGVLFIDVVFAQELPESEIQ